MNRGIVRQGFALITAVVISAAILATIVGIATLTVRETRVQAEQNASDQALAVAERGLADVFGRFRAADRALAIQVIGLPDSVPWEPSFSSGTNGTMNLGGHAFYWVKVVPEGTANTDRDYVTYAAGFIVRPNISSFTSSQLKTLAASLTDVVARRVVQVTSHGIVDTSLTPHTIPGQGGGTSPFDYGLFTGDTFSMVGSKNLANVTTSGTLGMYAVQDITMTSNHTLSNLDLFAEHAIHAEGITVVGGTLASISHRPAAGTATFPKLDLEAYMHLFDAFVAGTAPFGGPVKDSHGVVTNLGYPDLSLPIVRSAVLTALGNPQNNNVTVGGQTHHFVTPDQLSSYTDQVVNSTLPNTLTQTQKDALIATLSKSVFYARTSATSADTNWASERTYLAGVIMCSGNVTFVGCPDFANGQVAAILAGGNIDMRGGTKDGDQRGIFYAAGGVTYAGGGTFEGQMISHDTLNFVGGGDVTFKNYSSLLGDLLPGGDATTTYTTEINGFKSFSQNPSGWTEKAWADFPIS